MDALVAGALLGASTAVSPGPVSVEVASRAAESGFVDGLGVIIGAFAVMVPLAGMVLFGLLPAVGAYTPIFFLVGGLVLAWLGSKKLFGGAGSHKASGRTPLAAGFLVAATSPYEYVWWPAVYGGALLGFSGSGLAFTAAVFLPIALCLLGASLAGSLGAKIAGEKAMAVARVGGVLQLCWAAWFLLSFARAVAP